MISPTIRGEPDCMNAPWKSPSLWPPFVIIWRATDTDPALSPQLEYFTVRTALLQYDNTRHTWLPCPCLLRKHQRRSGSTGGPGALGRKSHCRRHVEKECLDILLTIMKTDIPNPCCFYFSAGKEAKSFDKVSFEIA